LLEGYLYLYEEQIERIKQKIKTRIPCLAPYIRQKIVSR